MRSWSLFLRRGT